MDYRSLPWRSSAIVLWLPEGETPGDAKQFNVEADLRPPSPNPEAWWELGQALLSIRAADAHRHGKVPWIKVGESIVPPDEILRAYEFFKNHGYGENA